ncbi:LysM peptidoglycan-binding domain-containing protein [Thioclava sp. F36-6]|uniref:LysM peptidoglycan-binding domain-containing protein n=1 Tax=Thioclava sp. F36-6 TaxID=1915316 RepID=UPI0009977A75|nr:LysM peptidoglycan-binding domain-containing protein [Thioclava sp. F36-6]OOY31159.1 peptidase M23 [Thioclava sp. F36-6]
MATKISRLRLILAGGVALTALAACNPNGFDLDMRGYGNGGLDTSAAARQAVQDRPRPNDQGIITYPNYQVVVARRGDTVNSVAQRIGTDPGALARYNAVSPDAVLNAGEVLALPNKVATTGGSATPGNSSALTSETIDITSLASNAIDRSQANQPAKPTPASAPVSTNSAEPIRHKVARGETAYSIARYYSVPVKALAEWNGLPNDLRVREGQVLIIPVASSRQPAKVETATATTAPGTGSPTPVPPSAAEPLPQKTPPKASEPVKTKTPDMSTDRTKASDTSKMAMPVPGSIIRPYKKGSNDGVDISASAGTAVKAAESGTVLLISQDTDDVAFLAIKHPDNLVTVYYNVTGITVKKGASVKRGQTIAKVASGDQGYLHFEVRKGIDSVDPMPYLN